MVRRFSDLILKRLPNDLKVCDDDPRVMQWVNEAMQRLIIEGSYWGLVARYRCSATSGLLAWPRSVASILAISLCDSPVTMRDIWFEFMESGIGLRSTENSSLVFTPREPSPFYNPITGYKKLKVYCDLAADVGKTVTFLGHDENLQWIRTTQGATVADGEVVAASLAGTVSTKTYAGVKWVRKEETTGPIRVYEYDSTTLAQDILAVYEYDETDPLYKISYISDLDTSASTDDPQTVEVLAKLDYVPIKKDDDYLLITCYPAIKDMAMAIVNAAKVQDSRIGFEILREGLKMAKHALEAESTHYLGNPKMVVNLQGAAGLLSTADETFV